MGKRRYPTDPMKVFLHLELKYVSPSLNQAGHLPLLVNHKEPAEILSVVSQLLLSGAPQLILHSLSYRKSM